MQACGQSSVEYGRVHVCQIRCFGPCCADPAFLTVQSVVTLRNQIMSEGSNHCHHLHNLAIAVNSRYFGCRSACVSCQFPTCAPLARTAAASIPLIPCLLALKGLLPWCILEDPLNEAAGVELLLLLLGLMAVLGAPLPSLHMGSFHHNLSSCCLALGITDVCEGLVMDCCLPRDRSIDSIC